jgi:hypothetical protein
LIYLTLVVAYAYDVPQAGLDNKGVLRRHNLRRLQILSSSGTGNSIASLDEDGVEIASASADDGLESESADNAVPMAGVAVLSILTDNQDTSAAALIMSSSETEDSIASLDEDGVESASADGAGVAGLMMMSSSGTGDSMASLDEDGIESASADSDDAGPVAGVAVSALLTDNQDRSAALMMMSSSGVWMAILLTVAALSLA